MVYFKVNRLLAKVIKLAEMKGKSSIGCTKDCDKQLISLDHVDICLEIICRKAAELEKEIEDQELLNEHAEESKKEKKDPKTKEEIAEYMRVLRIEGKALSIQRKSADQMRTIEKKLVELNEFKDSKAPELGRKAEMMLEMNR